MAVQEENKNKTEITVEEKLLALYELQQVDSSINRITILRGELPLEVRDLEDEIAGLETRIHNFKQEIDDLETEIANKKTEIATSEALIVKYEKQQLNVRNNREYDSLTKEIEYQTLDIELSNKKIKEFTVEIEMKNQLIEQSAEQLNERKSDLEHKKKELEDIIQETKNEEDNLKQKYLDIEDKIEERLLNAYKRIKNNARNKLAVVKIERNSCGGCHANIPPQRQLDIRSRKKIIVCEYCGRILVDRYLGGAPEEPEETEKPKKTTRRKKTVK